MSHGKLHYFFNEIFSFLTNKQFILNLIGIALFIVVVLFGVFSWLRYYTHHGQKLELPNYVDQPAIASIEDAAARTFEIIVNDSVFIVGKPGGIIRNQNPPGGALVKEKRKVYVTITKYTPDKVSLGDMRFFGEEYGQIQSQLSSKSIFSKIRDYKFDPLTQNAILEVWHNGHLVIDRRLNPENLEIDKGDTLEFVVSSSEGGSSEVPNLVNQSVEAAKFSLSARGLKLEIRYANDLGIDDDNRAVIVSQDPIVGTTLPRGSAVVVTVKAPN